MEKKYRYKVRKIYKSYALAEDGNEPGAKKRRFDAKAVDWNKGSATSYIAKYISKNIDGYGLESDLYGNDLDSAIPRVDAWASTYNIRQFQQVGGPSVTKWRELRRLKKEKSDPNIEALRKAADESNWCTYIELMEEKDLWVERQWCDKSGRYNEPLGWQITGLSLNGISYEPRVYVRME